MRLEKKGKRKHMHGRDAPPNPSPPGAPDASFELFDTSTFVMLEITDDCIGSESFMRLLITLDFMGNGVRLYCKFQTRLICG